MTVEPESIEKQNGIVNLPQCTHWYPVGQNTMLPNEFRQVLIFINHWLNGLSQC